MLAGLFHCVFFCSPISRSRRDPLQALGAKVIGFERSNSLATFFLSLLFWLRWTPILLLFSPRSLPSPNPPPPNLSPSREEVRPLSQPNGIFFISFLKKLSFFYMHPPLPPPPNFYPIFASPAPLFCQRKGNLSVIPTLFAHSFCPSPVIYSCALSNGV